ncbi:hypothetical protein HYH02_007031 [Chlamydomonas schloesseri]|uniref:Uncharacterized protein n=1 Tax=Chlamydomonas schloesseri TaxID=2026947 RepID=A0A835WI55_9CHLO|nr:hypothetical protein HYH02_007031 [Chlamydomonas schloesseri]|eukprot:KAG2448003.1 hypothetical protein HYH02_007031 [Chlamydomonas schloesseri]
MPYNTSLLRVACSLTPAAGSTSSSSNSSSSIGRRQFLSVAGGTAAPTGLLGAVAPAEGPPPYAAATPTAQASSGSSLQVARRLLLQAADATSSATAAPPASSPGQLAAAGTSVGIADSSEQLLPPPPGGALACGARLQLDVTIVVGVAGGTSSAASAVAAGGAEQELLQPLRDLADRLLRKHALMSDADAGGGTSSPLPPGCLPSWWATRNELGPQLPTSMASAVQLTTVSGQQLEGTRGGPDGGSNSSSSSGATASACQAVQAAGAAAFQAALGLAATGAPWLLPSAGSSSSISGSACTVEAATPTRIMELFEAPRVNGGSDGDKGSMALPPPSGGVGGEGSGTRFRRETPAAPRSAGGGTDGFASLAVPPSPPAMAQPLQLVASGIPSWTVAVMGVVGVLLLTGLGVAIMLIVKADSFALVIGGATAYTAAATTTAASSSAAAAAVGGGGNAFASAASASVPRNVVMNSSPLFEAEAAGAAGNAAGPGVGEGVTLATDITEIGPVV